MKTTILIASALLALAAAGCNQKSGWDKYNEDMAKVHAAWAQRDAERDAEYRADSTRWAIEDNTRKLDQLNADLRRLRR